MKKLYFPYIVARVKQHWEFFLALLFFIFTAISIWVEFTFFKFNLYSFLFVVNFNLILLSITFFIVVKHLLRLILERRRKIFGSHLRSRLVIAFVLTSLIPGIFIFVIFTRIVSTSVNYWFSSQVEDTLNKASVLGTTFFTTVSEELQEQAKHILNSSIPSIRTDKNISEEAINDINMKLLHKEIHSLETTSPYTILVLNKSFSPLIDITPMQEALLNKSLVTLEKNSFIQKSTFSFLEDIGEHDYVVFVQKVSYISEKNLQFIGPLQQGFIEEGYLLLAKIVGKGFTKAQKEIITGVLDYSKIHAYKNPIKFSFFYLLGILTLLMILGSTWYGLRISKQLTAPIVDLAKAFRQISEGKLNIVVEKNNMPEEMQMLIDSFNTMAKELSLSHSNLVLANTNLEKNNREIEIQKAHIETIIENITTGVIALDNNGFIERVNKPVQEMFNVQGIDLVGKKLENFIPKTFGTVLMEMEVFFASGKNRWEKHVTFRMNQEEKKVRIMALTLPIDSIEKGIVIVVDDITNLDKNYRIEAWREVARRIAHEIKNPLTPIKLSAQRLIKRYGTTIEDTVFTDCTTQIIHHVEHLQQLVTEFSRFAKLPEIVRTLGDIDILVHENIEFFRTTYPQIVFTYTKSKNIPMILFDASAMQRVFMNILKNAVEALEDIEKPQIDTSIVYNANLHTVQIRIHDNGQGIPQYEHNRLFEPYFSSKKEGTGLGLAIVQSIIADHRGYIRINPSEEKGTTIIIDLPT